MADMVKVYDTLHSFITVTNHMCDTEFSVLYCMLAEEWCKAHGTDIRGFISDIQMVVNEVNLSEGLY